MKHHIQSLDAKINWHWLDDVAALTVSKALTIQAIPAPTFQEAERARWVAAAFREAGLDEVETDSLHNVFGVLHGADRSLPGVMVSAHTDTIFSEDADLSTRQQGELIYGPGLGDNSIGVASLLGLVEALRLSGIQPQRDIWLVATSREEGLGDLGGMRAAFSRLHERLSSVINVEGLAYGHVYHGGIAVRRLHITAKTQGGHSWLHFGRPSAVHSIVQLGARITRISPPSQSRTTYNIGMIEGGEAINALATQAGLWLDMRSESRGALEMLESQVRLAVKACEMPDVTFSVETVGDRPAGMIAPEHPLVQTALAVLQHLGTRGSLETGSTDANIPLSEGVPAITIGITRGGNAHRPDEYIEVLPVRLGMRQLVLVTLAAAMNTDEVQT